MAAAITVAIRKDREGQGNLKTTEEMNRELIFSALPTDICISDIQRWTLE